MQPGDQVQKSRFTTSRGPDDAEKFSRHHLQIDAIESQQTFAAFGSITEADVSQTNLRNSGRNTPDRTQNIRHARRLSRLSRARRSACVDGNRKFDGKIMRVGAHWICFLPFSARTWLRSVKS